MFMVDVDRKVAILIPCYNESPTIAKVVKDFYRQFPDSTIYVFDNNSTDDTVVKAKEAGAVVMRELRQGKGYVVQKMFRTVDADIYVIVDGDDTYPAEKIHELIALVDKGIDVAVGDRLTNGTYARENKRSFHQLGNWVVRFMINKLFRVSLHDIMSGYRAFSKDFVKNYPVLCDGFQVETDMTIFALDYGYVIREVPVDYRDRPNGSFSKLSTFSDGAKVIFTIFNLYRHYRPLIFFGSISGIFLFFGILIGMPVIYEYITQSYIFRVPSAILASGMVLIAGIFFTVGLILDAVRRANHERFEIDRKNK